MYSQRVPAAPYRTGPLTGLGGGAERRPARTQRSETRASGSSPSGTRAVVFDAAATVADALPVAGRGAMETRGIIDPAAMDADLGVTTTFDSTGFSSAASSGDDSPMETAAQATRVVNRLR